MAINYNDTEKAVINITDPQGEGKKCTDAESYKHWDIYIFDNVKARIFSDGIYVGEGKNKDEMRKIIAVLGSDIEGRGYRPTTQTLARDIIAEIRRQKENR